MHDKNTNWMEKLVTVKYIYIVSKPWELWHTYILDFFILGQFLSYVRINLILSMKIY